MDDKKIMFEKEKNKYTNWEDQMHGLEKDMSLDLVSSHGKKPVEDLPHGEIGEMQDREEHERALREGLHKGPVDEHGMSVELDNPEMPRHLESLMSEHEDNKYKEWESQIHPGMKAEYDAQKQELMNAYHNLHKATEALHKHHIGFDKLVEKLKGEGKSEESAKNIAASVGRAKYGKGEFQHMAAEGKMHKGGEMDDEHNDSDSIDMGSIKQNSNSMDKSDEDLIGRDPKKEWDEDAHAFIMKDQPIFKSDEKADSSLAEKIEQLVLNHMHAHKKEEKEEGHKHTDELDKCACGMIKGMHIKRDHKMKKGMTQSNDETTAFGEWKKVWGYDWGVRQIGSTSSGKPIFANAKHPDHSGFSKKERQEASEWMERIAERAPHIPSNIQDGGMMLSKLFKEQAKLHKEMMDRQQKDVVVNDENLKNDIKESQLSPEHALTMPEAEWKKDDNKMQKAINWSNPVNPAMEISFKRGRNSYYQVDQMINDAFEKGKQLEKDRWSTGTHKEELKKSKALAIDQMIENNLDRSALEMENVQRLAKAKPIDGFNTQSFRMEEMISSITSDPIKQQELLKALDAGLDVKKK